MTIRVTLRVLHFRFDRCSHLTTFVLYHSTFLRLFMHCSVSHWTVRDTYHHSRNGD